ncbi:MAG: transglycosylase SLT domain-containing protein [Candidatus Acidiferrales bacterium]
MKTAGWFARAGGIALVLCAPCFAQARHAAIPVHKTARKTADKTVRKIDYAALRLERLSRALRDKKSNWAYGQLSEIAERKSSGVPAKRAALALEYYDYQRGEFEKAAEWMDIAQGDPLLGDYDLYWQALTNLALNHNPDALQELEQLRAQFPFSVMTEQALQSLGVAALAANQPADGVAALNAYSGTEKSPQLLFLRGELREQAGQKLDAAADYREVYVHFPLSDQARDAEGKLANLAATLGAQLQPIPVGTRLARAVKLFEAQDWSDAQSEYNTLVSSLSGLDLERAQVRILECGVEMGGDPSGLAALKIADPDVDAERDYTLADYYRGAANEPQMVAAVEAAATRAPSSFWTARSLFLAGNYYWVNLQRDQASSYYARLASQFPSSGNADSALWRITWTAVLKRDPDAVSKLEDHLKQFPDSQYTPDTLYWLGRLAQEANERARARAFYAKLESRFSQTYFANLAASRMRVLGRGPNTKEADDLLALIPPIPPAISMDDPPSEEADIRRARAAALRTIAFDSSAMLELRAAYASTHQPKLLLEAAQEAVAAGHCGAAIVLTRLLYPQLESRPLADVPRAVWLAAYALPYQVSIDHWSARKRLDPMLVAGLIHQESAFDPQAVSNANAYGLMQLISPTAHRLARQQGLRFSQMRLTEPDYNVRLGTAYLANLRKQFGNVEEVLAAYNAGEDRVTQWTAGQTYREPAEFVDSIPFSETRNYVEIVERNAAIYRRLYLARQKPSGNHKQHGD